MTHHPRSQHARRASTLVISMFIIALLALFIGAAFDYTRGTAYTARRGRDMTAAQALADGALEVAFKKWEVYMAANQSSVFATASAGTFASRRRFQDQDRRSHRRAARHQRRDQRFQGHRGQHLARRPGG